MFPLNHMSEALARTQHLEEVCRPTFSLSTNANPWVLPSVTSSHSNSSWLHPFLPSYLRAGLYQDSPNPHLWPSPNEGSCKSPVHSLHHPWWAGRELWKKCSNQKSSHQNGLKRAKNKVNNYPLYVSLSCTNHFNWRSSKECPCSKHRRVKKPKTQSNDLYNY